MDSYKNKVALYETQYITVFDLESFNKVLKKHNVQEEENEIPMDGCVFCDHSKNLYIIYVDGDGGIGIPTLNHEIFHLTVFIADRVGLDFERGESNEGFAYMISHLTDQILITWDKHQIKLEKRMEKENADDSIIDI